MLMDGGIGHAFISYLAGYPQSSYTTPHEINCSVAYETKNIHDSDHLGRVNGDSAGAYVPNIAGDEVALAALKSLAQNKKISAICLEQHEKGLVPDYEAIRARVLKEDEVLPIDQIGVRKYSTTVHMSGKLIQAGLSLKKNMWPKWTRSSQSSQGIASMNLLRQLLRNYQQNIGMLMKHSRRNVEWNICKNTSSAFLHVATMLAPLQFWGKIKKKLCKKIVKKGFTRLIRLIRLKLSQI